jgi:hypothetical protein
MAGAGHGPRIDDLAGKVDRLSDLVNTLQLQLSNLQSEVKAATPTLAEVGKSVVKIETAIALIQQQVGGFEHLKDQPGTTAKLNTEIELTKKDVGDLKKWQEEVKKSQEEWGRKAWAIIPPVLAVILTGLITFFLNLYFQRPGR